MISAHKGFYCMICDADQHKFIRVNDRKMYYSENYCRGIMGATLKPMMLL